MPSYTHGPTLLPGCDPKKDRCAYCDGKRIGRVLMIETGPKRGHWSWNGNWVGYENHGSEPTLMEALEALREGYETEGIEASKTPEGRRQPFMGAGWFLLVIVFASFLFQYGMAIWFPGVSFGSIFGRFMASW